MPRKIFLFYILWVILFYCSPSNAAKYNGSLLTNCRFYQLGSDEFFMKLSGKKLPDPKTEFIDNTIQITLNSTIINNPEGINASMLNTLGAVPLIYEFNAENLLGDALITIKTNTPMRLDSISRAADGYSLRIKPLETKSSFANTKIIMPERTAQAPENYLPFRVNTVVSIEFRETPLKDVLRMLMSYIGRNVIIDPSFPASCDVTMSIENMRIDDILDNLLRTYNLACFQAGKNTTSFGTKEALYKLSGSESTKAFKIKYAEVPAVKSLLVNLANISNDKIIVDERTRTLYIKTNPAKMEEAEEFIQRIDLPMRQVMIRASIFEFTDDDLDAVQNALDIAYDEWQISLSGGTLTLDYMNDRSPNPSQRTARTIQNVFAALETRNKGKIIANPSVTAIEGQEASITLKQEIMYHAGTDDNKNPKWDITKVGPELKFTPRIEDDGYINLDIRVNTGDYIGRDDDGNIRTTERTVTTQIRVKDGMPFVIGGLFSESTVRLTNRLPILGNIPLLGELFTYKGTEKNKTQAVMIITPYILDSR